MVTRKGVMPSGEKFSQHSLQLLRRSRLTFPHFEHLPPVPFERGHVPAVALHVREPFGLPELRVLFRRDAPVRAVVHVEEAAMDEDDLAPGGENEVGLAGQVFAVEPVTVAHAVSHGAHDHFGPRVAVADARPYSLTFRAAS